MLSLPKSGCELTYYNGDNLQQFRALSYNFEKLGLRRESLLLRNYKAALMFIQKHGLLEQFKLRAEQCIRWASPCGYGFESEIADLYYEYYNESP